MPNVAVRKPLPGIHGLVAIVPGSADAGQDLPV